MKKLFALLLVICLVLGLAACGPKTPDETTAGKNETTAGENKKPYEGKTLQVWGMSGNDGLWADSGLDKINSNVFTFMMRAALEDWAAINGAKIEYTSAFNNQNELLAAMNAGQKPDIVFIGGKECNAEFGTLMPLTDAHVTKILDVIDNTNYINYTAGKPYSVTVPWTGNTSLWYNLTWFQDANAKTPTEYFMEGNWTWETFRQACKDVAKDTNGDGTIDRFAMATHNFGNMRVPVITKDEKGNISSALANPEQKAFAELIYNMYNVDKSVAVGAGNAYTSAAKRTAFQIGDAEPYNYQHYYYTQATTGDKFQIVPLPVMDKDHIYNNYTPQWYGVPATCDEPDAAVDAIAFMLEKGLAYMGEYSLGLYKTDYKIIEGVSEYGAAWLKHFTESCIPGRKDAIEKDARFEDYDAAIHTKIMEYYAAAKPPRAQTATGLQNYFYVSSASAQIITMPFASFLAAVEPTIQGACDTYNSLYVW